MYNETWQPQFECIVFLPLIRSQQFAPVAHKNMTKTEPNDCRLGKSPFCAMKIVSDFTAHQHTNTFDVHEGANTHLTLLKDEVANVP